MEWWLNSKEELELMIINSCKYSEFQDVISFFNYMFEKAIFMPIL